VKVADGPKGREVIAVVSVDSAKAVGPKTQGTVLWFNPDKGYGFIKPDEGEKNIFVGMRSLRSVGLAKLDPGQRVEIEVMTSRMPRGPAPYGDRGKSAAEDRTRAQLRPR
jgi:CspA family cold shock protein